MSYKIRLNIFEGPFDLLVYLIERAEMSIYDIQISVITGQYLEHIRRMEENDVAVGSEFMVLAATLIEIKSKMLLPHLREDGTEAEDPRTDLTKKIVEYVRFKKAAAALEAQREFARLKLEKPQEDLLPFTGEPDVYLRMDMESFIGAFRGFIHRRAKGEELRRIQGGIEQNKRTLERKVSFIGKLLATARQAGRKMVRFAELLAGGGGGTGAGGGTDAGAGLSAAEIRSDRVTTLVAVLDMAKGGALKVRQETCFGEIEVYPMEENA